MKIKISVFLFLTALVLFIAAKDKEKNQNQITTNDNYNFISINQCLMWVSNNGDGSHDPRTDGSGFYWPKNSDGTYETPYGTTAVFEDGLVWGGIIDGAVKFNGNTHRQGLQAGKILDDGTPDDPGLEKYRIYKIRKNWELLPASADRDAYEKDYNEWPVEDGAPWIDVDGDGVFTRGIDKPEYIGDETLWYVSNDMDPERSTFTYGSLPIGLEFQVTVFAFDRANMLGDAVFKRYKIINKSGSEIKDMYFGYWSDPDLGNAGDDYAGCDTLLNIGYCFNGDNEDDYFYGSPPPALGYNMFERAFTESPGDSAIIEGKWQAGYKNVPFSAFVIYYGATFVPYRDPQQGIYEGTLEFYNFLQGKGWNGDPFVDPNTGNETKFVCAGDPVGGTGWYLGGGWPGGPAPGDIRLTYSTGPFDFAPGDTQNVSVGIFMAKGESNIESISELRRESKALQTFVESGYSIEQVPSPELHASVSVDKINLYWENNAESFSAKDVFYSRDAIEDTLYKFEGYIVWQYSDSKGSNPLLLKISDIKNDINTVNGFQIINGKRQFVNLFDSPNDGLINKFVVNRDYINNTELVYEKEYYFGVTAYAYFPESEEPFLESEPQIIKVRMNKPAVDYTYEGENVIIPQHTEGTGDGYLRVKIVDPSKLTGDEYKVVFHNSVYFDENTNRWSDDSLQYSLINKTTGDTLLNHKNDFISYLRDEYGNFYIPENDTIGKTVIDGFQLLISVSIVDSSKLGRTRYFVKDVEEVSGPGGMPLEKPVSVWDNPSPNGGWYVTAKGEVNRFIWQQTRGFEGLGTNDYEIRFNGESQFYASGRALTFFPILAPDTIGLGTVPFTVWDVKATTDDPSDDEQMLIKVLDFVRDENDNNDPERAMPDMLYSQLENGDWEEIYLFHTDLDMNDLPEVSPGFEARASPFGAFVFHGDLPEAGTVIRLSTVKPLTEGDVYTFNTTAANFNDKKTAQERINEITVFPNPYYAPDQIALGDEKVTFTRLPDKVKIRIYSLSGHLVKRLDKNDSSEHLDWYLDGDDGSSVNNGIYIAHLDMEGIGEKIIKIAVVR